MRSMRGHFFRRVGCGFLIFVLFMMGAFTAFFWTVSSALGLASIPEGLQAFVRAGGIFFLVFGMLSLILAVRALRGTALPLSRLLEGVSRVAHGDYSLRLDERGTRDVRELAQSYNEMVDRLQTTEQQRRELLAEVTHELRTPITVIQGNLEGMLDGIYPADPEHLNTILDETRILSRIVEDLRTLSLAEGGALKLDLQRVDLGELIQETSEAFQAQAASAGVSLRAEIQLDPAVVEADPTRIREVLANLISNALRYTPEKGEIAVMLKPGGENRAVVAVQDSGRGIPPEDLPRIFDRFYKSSDSRGSGLGLAISRSLVAAHHGEISARSEPGQGTTIEFTLPVVQ